ncbi:MAG: DUF3073 domain-containing protein [Jatrophihabitans sp.]
MGRGRAKAKQQKVARDLKYNTHFTDLDALQRELGTSAPGGSRVEESAENDADDYDGWTGTDR